MNNTRKIRKKLVGKKIFVHPKKLKALRAECGFSEAFVFQSFRYAYNSDAAKEVRRLAMQPYYGGVMREIYEREITEEDI